MDNWIDELNSTWDSIAKEINLKEDTIKDYIVKPFLEHIGYDKNSCWHIPEKNVGDGRVDIFVELKERKNEGIFVETKRGDEPIETIHIKQLVQYLIGENIQWGILTNGKEYYLINKDITSEKNNTNGEALLDRVVLVCDLKDRIENIKFFSKEYIFYNRKTLLIRDIAQFKAYKSYKNWNVYFSTLYGFFNYYCEVIEPDLKITDPYTSSYLSDIREKDFRQYLLTLSPKDKNKEKLSVNIVKSKCSHISAMYEEFEKRKKISSNNFRNIRTNIVKQFISEGIVIENKKNQNYLTQENVETIINNFSKSDKNETVIRLIIFCLIIYYGFTKTQVVEFLSQPWDCIIFNENKVKYLGIKRNMPPLLETNFKKLKKVTGKRKNILGNKGERGQSISIDIVSATFEEIKKMKDVEGRKHFTPEYTRKMLIITLFETGFSIEEICGYIGISITAIENILGKENIATIGLKRWNIKSKSKVRHPFEEKLN